MAARKVFGINWIFAFLFSLVSLGFILLILLSGLGGHAIASYLTIDTKDLSVPAKLGNSNFLSDLSQIAGQDWVGSDQNAQSLGLSSTYILNLLTACSESSDGSTTCGAPKIGFNFDPSSDLHLAGTSMQGTFSSAYSDELQTYSKVSMFLSIGYLVGAALTVLSCLFMIVAICFPGAIRVSLFASALSFLFLLATAIAAVVTFFKLKTTFNDALGAWGVQSQTSSQMFGLAFGAAGLALVTIILLVPLSRGPRNARRQAGFDGKGKTKGVVTGEEEPVPAVGLFRRVTTWNRHKYTQVEKQKPVVYNRSPSRDSDRDGLIATVEDDFSHEYPNDFAMGPMQKKKNHNGPSRNPNAAYDPDVQTAYEPQMAYDPVKA
ncbi:hypothetical protein GGR54DRAFT_604552 [Hypoxylon sp. NC1633]|nr:hypothetical protein GGR54DRAFT_604552 [Hypoxylon sp. NC1633]